MKAENGAWHASGLGYDGDDGQHEYQSDCDDNGSQTQVSGEVESKNVAVD